VSSAARSIEAELRGLVDSFLVKLRDVVQRQALEAVRASLLAPTRAIPASKPRPAPKAAPKPMAKRATKPAAKPARVRRSPEQIAGEQQRILDHIAARPGETAEEIRGALNIPKNVWTLTIAGLALEGRAERTGEKRTTRYYEPGKAPR
jgi:hypothetical protein